jgi:hypothetical protein
MADTLPHTFLFLRYDISSAEITRWVNRWCDHKWWVGNTSPTYWAQRLLCVSPDLVVKYPTQSLCGIWQRLCVLYWSLRMQCKLNGFMADMECVHCAVRTLCFNINQFKLRITRVKECSGSLLNYRHKSTLLTVLACWPLVLKIAGSLPTEAVGFFRLEKSTACLPSEGK